MVNAAIGERQNREIAPELTPPEVVQLGPRNGRADQTGVTDVVIGEGVQHLVDHRGRFAGIRAEWNGAGWVVIDIAGVSATRGHNRTPTWIRGAAATFHAGVHSRCQAGTGPRRPYDARQLVARPNW